MILIFVAFVFFIAVVLLACRIALTRIFASVGLVGFLVVCFFGWLLNSGAI